MSDNGPDEVLTVKTKGGKLKQPWRWDDHYYVGAAVAVDRVTTIHQFFTNKQLPADHPLI